MRILALGLNYAPEEIGISIYTSGLCEELARRGHEVHVVTAQPYYPQWKVHPGFVGGWKRTFERGVDVTRCPIYVPSMPSGPKRLLHHASFALSSLLPTVLAARKLRPDLIVTVAPSLIGAPVAWLAAKLTGARSWLHVQDFEVEAAFATGLLDPSTTVARWARKCERAVIRLFDRVSSISPEMCAKLQAIGLRDEQIMEFRNWADIEAIRPIDAISSYRTEWNISAPHVALYSGNIANKQGIGIVVEAARRLSHRADLKFVICGEGPNRVNVEKEADGLENIEFHDLQPVARLAELMGLATIHLLPQKGDAADLVLPSKLTNMLASGRPIVVTAGPGTGLARETEACGVITPPEDAAAFAAGIERLIDDPIFHREASASARERAEQVWNSKSIIDGFERHASALIASG